MPNTIGKRVPSRRGVERVLIIKLSALGDLVLAFGPLASIRAHHPRAEITLLTTPPYAELARRSPWVDVVLGDGRPRWADASALLRLARRLRIGRFQRVYDLQTSRRSSRYRWLVGTSAEWSGIASGSSHPHANPARNSMHTVERQREQLERAGVRSFSVPDLSWLDADLSHLGLPGQFALLIPGASPGRPAKLWPRFPDLASALKMPVVIVGTVGEAALAAMIVAKRPDAVDLTGRTSLVQLGSLARKAILAVGNDTGPTHLAAAVGCPTLALFGEASNPHLTAPRGPRVRVLQRASLPLLGVDEVLASLSEMRGPWTPPSRP